MFPPHISTDDYLPIRSDELTYLGNWLLYISVYVYLCLSWRLVYCMEEHESFVVAITDRTIPRYLCVTTGQSAHLGVRRQKLY